MEKKVFRDPIYGYITVSDELVWNIINTKEFQRLKRIHQLGGVSAVFHTAEHSRFSHSLGVYQNAVRLIREVEGLQEALSEYEVKLLYAASLLHDIGHGPFSHAFEDAFEFDHEEFSTRVILEKTDVSKVLKEANPDLPADLVSIIKKDGKFPLLEGIVSSQLDIDRLDYLARDAYFTGATYGEIDVDRIIRTMRIKNKEIVHKASSVHAIEDYLMSRYNMYWQVYFHPVGRSFEIVLDKIYKRIKVLYHQGYVFDGVAKYLVKIMQEGSVVLDDYLMLDDYLITTMISEFRFSDDFILKDLSNRLLSRKLFKDKLLVGNVETQYQQIKELMKKAGISTTYYLKSDNLAQIVYNSNFAIEKASGIKILLEDGTIKELKDYSKIVNALIDAARKEEVRVYYPKDLIEAVEDSVLKEQLRKLLG
ncbi:MAG TPA: HD domain-containing protein [Bacilli bacterium]|nr:HD domain-containing protein [Bacilli bacterium]